MGAKIFYYFFFFFKQDPSVPHPIPTWQLQRPFFFMSLWSALFCLLSTVPWSYPKVGWNRLHNCSHSLQPLSFCSKKCFKFVCTYYEYQHSVVMISVNYRLPIACEPPQAILHCFYVLCLQKYGGCFSFVSFQKYNGKTRKIGFPTLLFPSPTIRQASPSMKQ